MYRTGLLLLCIPVLLLTGRPTAALEMEECRVSAGAAHSSIKARCATLMRPENPDDPESALLGIRVVVIPALNLTPEPDPIVPLAGGPGQSAVQFYAAYRDAFEFARRNRDILLVDQRGTGESALMDCPVDENLVEGQFSVELTVQFTKDCLDALPYDPRFFTTSVAVLDLEAVRKALGYPALNLYGVSYGSRVAQHYVRRYPDTTRSLVLDGVVPPQLVLGANIAIEAQRALDRIFRRCREDVACNERFPDLAISFAKLHSKLSDRAVDLEIADPVSGNPETLSFGKFELAAAIRLLAYHPNTIATIPLLVSEAAAGNYRPLASQYLMTVSRLRESLALGMHNAVMCIEDAPYYDDLDIDMRALRASYIGMTQLEAIRAMCSVWPAGLVDDDLKLPLATDIPTLLLSGDADPVTPPAYADIAARGMKKAWLLTLADQGHGQLPVGCMPRIFEQFVSNAGLDGVDTDCRQKSFAMPFFLDFSGPLP